VLTEALRLVDKEGIDALTTQALGARLDVEAMSLYNHVPSKQALHEGIGALLWAELEGSTEPQDDWRRSIRALADGLRRLAREHPNAYALLLTPRRVSPAPGLRAVRAQLETMRADGLGDSRAADILRAVVGYAIGYALLELSSLSVSRAGDAGQDADLDSLWALARSLPPDLPPDLAHVARAVCLCDMDRQFEVGLDALLAGLDPDCNTR
jgi:AcrR family transcriptional regulator